ncbi:MAG: DUF481 domain-containing protein [Desulfobacterales bacterium]|nr:DUF481 domain-containing protein [Desulfobacterales bacterium]
MRKVGKWFFVVFLAVLFIVPAATSIAQEKSDTDAEPAQQKSDTDAESAETSTAQEKSDTDAEPAQQKSDTDAEPDETSTAQQKPDTDAEPVAKPQKPKPPPMWWQMSPLSYPTISDFLYHVEGIYKYSQAEGNVSNDNHVARVKLVLRKHRFSSYLTYLFVKKYSLTASDSEYPLILTDSEGDIPRDQDGNLTRQPTGFRYHEYDTVTRDDTTQKFNGDFRFAITDRIYIAPGITWEENELNGINMRMRYYGGLGVRIIQRKNFLLQVFGAYAYEDVDYFDWMDDMAKGLDDVNIKHDYKEGTSDNIYISQYAKWQVSKDIALNETLKYISNINEGSRYRYTLDIELEYKIAPHVFITSSYNDTYDNASTFYVRNRDSGIKFGLKVKF